MKRRTCVCVIYGSVAFELRKKLCTARHGSLLLNVIPRDSLSKREVKGLREIKAVRLTECKYHSRAKRGLNPERGKDAAVLRNRGNASRLEGLSLSLSFVAKEISSPRDVKNSVPSHLDLIRLQPLAIFLLALITSRQIMSEELVGEPRRGINPSFSLVCPENVSENGRSPTRQNDAAISISKRLAT